MELVGSATLLAADRAEASTLAGRTMGLDAFPIKPVVSGASLCSLDTQPPSDSESDPVTAHEEAFWADEPEACAAPAPHAAPAQTLIFLDWDDTLFPTTELMDRRHVPEWGQDVPEEVEAHLGAWRAALKDFLAAACSASSRCVILTNAGRPWVDVCVERFVPELRPMFSKTGPLRVVYASEALKRSRARTHKKSSCCLAGLAAWLAARDDEEMDAERRRAEMTAGKRAGMEEEALDFYGAGAPWENILSVGDASYERHAVRSLIGGRGALRAKAVMVPRAPSLEELVDSLTLARQRLAGYVAFDGHLDLEQSGSSPVPDQL